LYFYFKLKIMPNEIVKRQSSLTELMSIADAFAKSGLFEDTKSAAQAIVKIQAGAEMGIEPFAAMTGIHIIKGKPGVGSGLMASKVKSSGKYNYKIVKLDNTIASIDFYENNVRQGNSTFTLQDAQTAGTQNIQKFPRNMLFARAMSNGVRWFAPDVFTTPVYTPEELNGGSETEETPFEDVAHEDLTKPAPTAPMKKAVTDKAVQAAVERFLGGEMDVLDKLAGMYDLTAEQQKMIAGAVSTKNPAEEITDDIPA
jgi:hypothetical protein